MEHVFLAVQGQLQTAVTELKWIDYDFAQLDSYQMRPPVLFPCALIDVELPECRDLGKHDGMMGQLCRCQVTVRLAFEQPGQTHNKAPEEAKEKAMTIFAALNKIRAALHGFEGEGFNKLLLRSVVTERREDPLKVFNLRFETSFTTRKTKEWVEMEVTPVIETTLDAR
jgi:hypothetical protein